MNDLFNLITGKFRTAVTGYGNRYVYDTWYLGLYIGLYSM